MRLIARFALETEGEFVIIDIFDRETRRTPVDKADPRAETIAKRYPAAIWFERKIRDDFGILFFDSFDHRPLLHHERFPRALHPMQKSFSGEIEFAPYIPYAYEAISGDGVFQVAVGPIHAGIIEPGHFHFSQEGENMLHQEVRHFYKWRGIEKMVEGKNPSEIIDIVEKISGNESIAYQSAYFNILADASSQKIPEGLRKYHALLLELERLAHHLTDLGFIPNDAGFSAALAFASMKVEELRRQLQILTSHRFGFGAVRGATAEFDRRKFELFLDSLEKEMRWFEEWIMDIPSLWDRFDTTGVLTENDARKYSVTGVMARASGVGIDRRENHFYHSLGFEKQAEQSGDVAARFKIRLKELFNSIEIIRNCLDFDHVDMTFSHFSDGEYHAYVESSIGELLIYLRILDGKVDRFFSRDPSFVNWQALHLMMPGNIIADFPLINKSCDLSYAGNDL